MRGRGVQGEEKKLSRTPSVQSMASMNSPTIPDALISADLSFQILNDHATQHRKRNLGHACPGLAYPGARVP